MLTVQPSDCHQSMSARTACVGHIVSDSQAYRAKQRRAVDSTNLGLLVAVDGHAQSCSIIASCACRLSLCCQRAGYNLALHTVVDSVVTSCCVHGRFDAAKPDEPPQLFRDTALRSAEFRASDFQTRQVFVRSRDGMRVPMFIVARKGIQLDGSNPTLLYGYGGASCTLHLEL